MNAILIHYNNTPLNVILVHKIEFASLDEILNYYSQEYDFHRNKLSGQWIDVLDITDCQHGIASKPSAKHEWPANFNRGG